MNRVPKLVFMLKTYRNDIEYVKRLILGYEQHNRDNIPLYIVVPENDIDLFKETLGDNYSVVAEESIPVEYCEGEMQGLSIGYINQEIVKLAFWKLGLCANYVCLDSDVIFIRDFYIKDFLYEEDIPYTVLIQDKDLHADPDYYRGYWVAREAALARIKQELGMKTGTTEAWTCHGFQIMSCKVLESLERDYMIPKQRSYVDLLRISPYEFSWYNFYLQKSGIIPIMHSEPLFKYIHTNFQFVFYKMMGIKQEDWARSYIGVIVNSNFSRGMEVKDYNQMIPNEYGVLREYEQVRVVLKVLFHSIFKIMIRKSKRLILNIVKRK